MVQPFYLLGVALPMAATNGTKTPNRSLSTSSSQKASSSTPKVASPYLPSKLVLLIRTLNTYLETALILSAFYTTSVKMIPPLTSTIKVPHPSSLTAAPSRTALATMPTSHFLLLTAAIPLPAPAISALITFQQFQLSLVLVHWIWNLLNIALFRKIVLTKPVRRFSLVSSSPKRSSSTVLVPLLNSKLAPTTPDQPNG